MLTGDDATVHLNVYGQSERCYPYFYFLCTRNREQNKYGNGESSRCYKTGSTFMSNLIILSKRAPAEDERRFLTFLVVPKFSENYSNNEHNENYSKYSDL